MSQVDVQERLRALREQALRDARSLLPGSGSIAPSLTWTWAMVPSG